MRRHQWLIIFSLLIISVILLHQRAQAYYIFEEESFYDEITSDAFWFSYTKDKKELLEGMKETRPWHYYFTAALNPPQLDTFFWFVVTILVAIGSLFSIVGFHFHGKIIVGLLCLYSWSRIINFFVITNLIKAAVGEYGY